MLSKLGMAVTEYKRTHTPFPRHMAPRLPVRLPGSLPFTQPGDCGLKCLITQLPYPHGAIRPIGNCPTGGSQDKCLPRKPTKPERHSSTLRALPSCLRSVDSSPGTSPVEPVSPIYCAANRASAARSRRRPIRFRGYTLAPEQTGSRGTISWPGSLFVFLGGELRQENHSVGRR